MMAMYRKALIAFTVPFRALLLLLQIACFLLLSAACILVAAFAALIHIPVRDGPKLAPATT